MKIRGMPKRTARLLVVGAAVIGLGLLMAQPILTAPGLPLLEKNFTQANEQGFGDRQNSWSWSMQWWNGKLYVGANRAEECWSQASLAYNFPDLIQYPPTDPDIECTDSPQDLPLQAEIWRWTPETETWERVYQSPNDVEIPGYPGKYVARDIGFRGMTLLTEADGTEALYVGGVTSRMYNKGIPPPRILRSTDGATFEPVPQDPGTFLGDLETLDGIDMNSFRAMAAYNGRLYITAGRIRGDGVLLEGENPAGGNDNFRMVSPPGLRVFDILPYNGLLYVATYNPIEGYSVLKTDAVGTPPYAFTPVVTNGGFAWPLYSRGALSMHIFKGRLYVGTDRPAEVIRINPDDSWDLIVGRPRETPDGMKDPLSGFGPGFDYSMNVHIWRMQGHEGWLYVGTCDLQRILRHQGLPRGAWRGVHYLFPTRAEIRRQPCTEPSRSDGEGWTVELKSVGGSSSEPQPRLRQAARTTGGGNRRRRGSTVMGASAWSNSIPHLPIRLHLRCPVPNPQSRSLRLGSVQA